MSGDCYEKCGNYADDLFVMPENFSLNHLVWGILSGMWTDLTQII